MKSNLHMRAPYSVTVAHVFKENLLTCLIQAKSTMMIDSLQGGNDLLPIAAAGAATSGACMLCQAGAYQTGSGQIGYLL